MVASLASHGLSRAHYPHSVLGLLSLLFFSLPKRWALPRDLLASFPGSSLALLPGRPQPFRVGSHFPSEQLLTGKPSVLFQGLVTIKDVSLCFSQEEWRSLDPSQTDFYGEYVMQENCGIVVSLSKQDLPLPERLFLGRMGPPVGSRLPGGLSLAGALSRLPPKKEYWS